VGDPFSTCSLEASTAGLVTEIHPFRDVSIAKRPPGTGHLVRIGLGRVEGDWDVRIGARGWIAGFGAAAGAIEPDALWGAALAACLAANCAFQCQLGRAAAISGSFSLWDYGGTSHAQGPRCGGPLGPSAADPELPTSRSSRRRSSSSSTPLSATEAPQGRLLAATSPSFGSCARPRSPGSRRAP